MELVYQRNAFNLAKIFVLQLFRIVGKIKQRAPGLSRGLSSNFCCLKSANHMKFMQDYVMCTEKDILVKKLFINGLKMGLPRQACVKKTVHVVEIHWITSKEKVPGEAVSKEGHADCLLGYKRTHYNWFLWKWCNS